MRKDRFLPPIAVRRGRAGLLRTTALQAAAVLAFITPAAAQPAATARPQGGTVVRGTAGIAQTTDQTTVTQATQRAAINWNSFDVGSAHTVQYNQPNASAVVLNRVTGPDPSQIAGRIQANGQVIITNQSGVVFHQGAQVDAAGLIVSAAGISNRNFMAGNMVFDRAPKPDAAVTNAGTITVKDTGLAALVAPRVVNSGTISARMGRAVLAGAETHTVDLYGDGLLAIDVTGQVRQAPRGPDGKPATALVTNTGTVIAQGGSVQITAAAADGIVQNLVQAGGTIRADAAGGKTGTVVIAGVGGSLRIEGRVAADGGGTVAIGTRATAGVTVAETARVSANGRAGGDGGKVTILSAGTTTIAGRVTARASRSGGNGGNIELSGKTVGLTETARVDTAAPRGRGGLTLIDPTDITISDHGGSGTVITPASLEAMGSVSLQADNSIVASSSVTLGGESNFTLNAGNFIRVDANVTLASDIVTLKAGIGGISLLGSINARSYPGLIFDTTGPVTQGTGSVITSQTISGNVGSATLTSPLNQIDAVGYNPFTIGGVLSATTGDISVTSANALAIQGAYFTAGSVVPNGRAITFTADTITIPNSQYGNQNASAPGGSITLQPLTAGRLVDVLPNPGQTLADRLYIDSASLSRLSAPTLGVGSTGAGTVTLASGGTTIDFGSLGFTTLRLRSGGNIGQVGSIGIGNVDAVAANVDLSAAGNFIPAITQLAATSNALLHTGQTLTVNGTVQGGTAVVLSSGGTASPSMILNADIRGGTVRLDTFNGTSLATSGAIQQNAGTITGTQLSGQAGSAVLNQANAIPLGGFQTAGDFSYNGATSILIGGTLQVGGTANFTTPGAITQATTSGLTANVLTGTAGSANFSSTDNVIATLGNFATSAGSLSVVTRLNGNTPFLIDGVVTVPSTQTISLFADRLAFRAASLSAPDGLVILSQLSLNRPAELVATGAGQSAAALSLTQANLNTISTDTLQLGNSNGGPITLGGTGEAITLTGHARVLSLVSAGTVTQGAGATLTVPVLSAAAASVTLPGANAVGALGFITTGALTFANAASFNVLGPVAVTGDASLTATGAASAITLTGNLSANNATIGSGTGGIVQNAGTLAITRRLSLATTGAVTQATTGVIQAATLGGGAGSLALGNGANQVASLDGLVVAGPALLRTSGALTAVNTSSATSFDLGAASLTVGGTLSATGAVNLAITGAVSVTGTLQATTLTGSAASAAIGGTSAIGTIGAFTATAGSFVLVDTTALNVAGPLTATTGVGLTAPGTLTISGDIGAPNVALIANPAGTIPGNIVQTAGTVSGATTLTAAGSITQTAGRFTSTVLNGSAVGEVALLGTNAVQSLGPFTSGGNFTLVNGTNALSIGGALNAGANTVALIAGNLTQTAAGTITAATLTGNTANADLGTAANRIAALGDFTSAGALTLNDATPLTVTGPVSAATTALTTTGTLTLAGTIAATSLALTANGAITQPGGGVTATSLTVTAPSATLGQAANNVATLGTATVPGAFALTDGRSLAVAGPVASNASVRLDVTGDLTLSGTVAAPAVTLLASGNVTQTGGSITATTVSGTAGGAFLLGSTSNQIVNLGPVTAATTITVTDARSLTITGAIDPPDVTLNITGDLAINNSVTAGLLTLNVSGAVTEGQGGALFAATLAGSVGSAQLDNASIAAIGAFTSIGTFTFTDAVPLTVTGTLSAPTLALTAPGTLTIAGAITAPDTTLTALSSEQGSGSILQTGGTITAGTRLRLVANDAITQTGGSIVTPLLTGSAGSAALGSSGNAIGTISGFTSGSTLALRNNQALAVTGVTASEGIALNVAGPLSITGLVSARSVDLVATGTITEGLAGAITATQLTGSAAAATLDNAANQVQALGRFATTGDFLLATPSNLFVTGAVSVGTARTLTLTTGALTLRGGGSLTAPGGTVALAPFQSGTPFTLASQLPASTLGAITAATLQVGNGLSGDITVSGAFNLGSVGTLALVSGGAITQATGATITVPTLRASGALVRLDQANDITTLGNSASGSAFTLTTSGPLTVAGTVTAESTLTLNGAGLTIGTATTQGILSAPGQIALNQGPYDITEVNGFITTLGTLTGSSRNVTLGGANRIGTLGAFAVPSIAPTHDTQFTLNDLLPLTVSSAGLGYTATTLTTSGALTLNGTIGGPIVNLNAASITQPGGTTAAGLLNLAVAGDASLATRLDALGTARVGGTLRLVDSGPVGFRVAGPVTATTLDLAANGVFFDGSVQVGTLRLAAGTVTQRSGSIQAGVLTGTATSLSLGTPGTQAALIGTVTDLGTGSGGGTLVVNSGVPLTVSGTIAGTEVQLRGTGGVRLSGATLVADQATIQALNAQPVATATLEDGPTMIPVAAAGPAGIVQPGTFTVRPFSRTTDVLSLIVDGGTITLGNLVGPATRLVLAMNGGNATGNLAVNELFVSDQGGSAALSGTVGGLVGFAAAQASGIVRFDPAYTLNGCAIASTSCGPVIIPPPPPIDPGQGGGGGGGGTTTIIIPPVDPIEPTVRLVVPTTIRPDIVSVESLLRPDLFTVDLITLDIVRNPSDPEFTLPNISDRDY